MKRVLQLTERGFICVMITDQEFEEIQREKHH